MLQFRQSSVGDEEMGPCSLYLCCIVSYRASHLISSNVTHSSDRPYDHIYLIVASIDPTIESTPQHRLWTYPTVPMNKSLWGICPATLPLGQLACAIRVKYPVRTHLTNNNGTLASPTEIRDHGWHGIFRSTTVLEW